MPDQTDNTQSLNPAQILAGNVPPTPTAQPIPPQSQQPIPQQPSPQQVADVARHSALGRATRFLFGQERDPNTGEPVRQQPGAVFRSLLAGALLGGAIGSEGRAGGGSVGGFLSGAARGGNAVVQQQYARQQDAFARQRQTEQLDLEQQRFAEEQKQNAAALEHWNLEALARGREADYRDREWLQREQAQDNDLQKWAIQNNAQLANIPGNATPGNGPKLMRDMTNNQASFQAPSGYGRLLIKHFDFDGLEHDEKNGWTENGKPVDWARHLQWDVYYVPLDPQAKKQVVMSGADWQKYYGVKGLAPEQNYSVDSVSHLVAAATTQRRNERESGNQDFKERHDALQGTINSARTNVTQLESEKRELLHQGYSEDDDEVTEIESKIQDEKKREQDAIADMHPRIRERVKQAPAPKPNAAPSAAPKKGDTQVHAGYSYSFDGKQWVRGNPVQ